MSGNCKDCRWFYDRKVDSGWGFCAKATGEDYGAAHSDSKAYASTAVEDGLALLYVSPDFGCVQFEAKGKE